MRAEILCRGAWDNTGEVPGRPGSAKRPYEAEKPQVYGLAIYTDVAQRVNQGNVLSRTDRRRLNLLAMFASVFAKNTIERYA